MGTGGEKKYKAILGDDWISVAGCRGIAGKNLERSAYVGEGYE